MISVKLSALKASTPLEYFTRFAFGGAATILAGLIAQRFGPGLGGLFLAFPAIFPATATLIEAHEKKRMAKTGHDGTNRGRSGKPRRGRRLAWLRWACGIRRHPLDHAPLAQRLAEHDYRACGVGSRIRCALEIRKIHGLPFRPSK